MKAVVVQDGHEFALQEVSEPQLQTNDDVIVKVATCAICGSDIHAKHGLIPGMTPGTVIGHEFVGVIEETGSDVTRFKKGDRVAVPAATWCGHCTACKRGEVQYCENGGVWGGGEIFGRGLSGAQTSYVRVPYADVCLTPIPDSVSDEQAVFVGDVFSTGYHAAKEGHIRTGDTVVIYGCGPIGLGALVSAWQFGPKQVFSIDMLENRLNLAALYGARTINASQGNVVEQIHEATGGQGADVVIEAIGNPLTFQMALKSVRRGGAVSVVGLFPTPVEFPLQELSFYGVRISMGLGNLSHMGQLMGLLESGKVDLNPLITHTFSLNDAMQAYDLFENQKDKCLKVLLKP
jgi:2-desacetyl-2-hydroxyethyl bacteriochlorophyllide A dehydrogenase